MRLGLVVVVVVVVVVVEGRLGESHGRRRPIEEEGRIEWNGWYGEGTSASEAREGSCLEDRGLGLLGICLMGSKRPITDVPTE